MEKNGKKGILIGITLLFVVTLVLLGLTYAYYRTRVIGNQSEDPSVSITSKKLEVTYQNESAYIEASKISPGYTATKTFEVKNTGSEAAKYSVILSDIVNTFERNHDWTYTLQKNGSQVASGYIVAGSTQILVPSATIAAGTTNEDSIDSYTFTLTYADSNENQSIDMGKTLNFKLDISDETNTWEVPGTGTLLAAIKSANQVVEPLTIPGKAVPSDEEALLASTEDEYGTSYYFRGGVENNFVTFNNMCWRIVRVQGDGSIKLILADDSAGCSSATTADDSAYIGFATYGSDVNEIGNTTFEYANFKNSTDSYANDAQKFLNVFYEGGTITEKATTFTLTFSGFKNVDSYLKTEKWCIGDTENAYDWTTYEKLDSSVAEIKQKWVNEYPSLYDDDDAMTAYEKANRFYYKGRANVKSGNPDMICRYGYDYAEQKVGMLTGDEAVFAGYIYKDLGTNNYLDANATNYSWWTMSQASFGDNYSFDYSLVVNRSHCSSVNPCGMYNADVGNSGVKVRPAIVLNSTVKISGGTGILTDPYVVS